MKDKQRERERETGTRRGTNSENKRGIERDRKSER